MSLMMGVSGIRGIVGRTMTEELARRAGAAFAEFLHDDVDPACIGKPPHPALSPKGGDGSQDALVDCRIRVVVGRDSRTSGPAYLRAVTDGLTAGGCDVVDLGLATTPGVGIMVRRHHAAGGVVITASHNPIEYNGIKFLTAQGCAPDARTAGRILERVRGGGLCCADERTGAGAGALPGRPLADEPPVARTRVAHTQVTHKRGRVTVDDTTAAQHVALVLQTVDVERIRDRRFRVVLDSVCGAGGPSGRALLEALGCRVEHLNAEPSGCFPHAPEPTAENLRDTTAHVARGGDQEGTKGRDQETKGPRERGIRIPHSALLTPHWANPQSAIRGAPWAPQSHGFDVTFAQDPDADRLAIIDESGRYIGEEYTLALAALHVLGHRPGPVVVNLSTSRMVDDVAARYPGAAVVRSAVGEANIVEKMIEHGAVLGGEGNGGVIDPRVGWVRDSLAAMALVLDLLADRQAPLSAVLSEIPAYVMIKRKFECAADRIAAAVGAVRERYAAEIGTEGPRDQATKGPRDQGTEVCGTGHWPVCAVRGAEGPKDEGTEEPRDPSTERKATQRRSDEEAGRLSGGCRINDADGVRLDWPEGWVHLRGSNTEPIMRLIAEARTDAAATDLVERVRSVVEGVLRG